MRRSYIHIDYEQTLPLIRHMRRHNNAEVDTLGASALPRGSGSTFRFQALVSLMLSSMTKDSATAAAMRRLQAQGLCTAEDISKVSEIELQNILRGVGFHNRKAKYLKETSSILVDKYGGDMPEDLDKLLELPGVGSKMAKIAIEVAYGKCVGIGVDTHVHRIANRLGWVSTKSPPATETQLEDLLPREEWAGINKLLVGFGQQICTAKKPMCDKCDLSEGNLCPRIGVLMKKSSKS